MHAELAKPADRQPATGPIRLRVPGMSCASCVARIERSLRAIAGVHAVQADLASQIVSVTAEPGVTIDDAAMAVYRAGYEVATQEVALQVAGMTRLSHGAAVERALGTLPGVTAVAVDLATGKAAVQALAGVPIDEMTAALRRAGYEARPDTRQASAPGQPTAGQRPERWPAAPEQVAAVRWPRAASADVINTLEALGSQTAAIVGRSQDGVILSNRRPFTLGRTRRGWRSAASH